MKSSDEITPQLIDAVCGRLAMDRRVRRTLPSKGRLHIDRQLPFLSLYRRPPDREDAGTERMVIGEASYLVASGEARLARSLTSLVRNVAGTLSAAFGAFLVVEIWSAPEGGRANDPANPAVLPRFTIHGPTGVALTSTIEALERQLRRIKIQKQSIEVEVRRGGPTHPPSLRSPLSDADAREIDCYIIGLSVPPVFRKPGSSEAFPILVRSLRRSLGLALRQAYFEFARARTTQQPPHFHSLGRRAVVKAVWDVDRKLAEVSKQFDYLLQLMPVNADDAWRLFKRRRFECAPEFHYRPLPVDPALLKRALFRIPIERIEDPALQRLFQEKVEELELKLTMLRDRDTPRFRYESLQLYDTVNDELLLLAKELLRDPPMKSRSGKGERITANAFAELAEREFTHYRRSWPEFRAKVRVTRKVSGLMVSRGVLLINPDLRVPPARVEALLAHEVGTHLFTYNCGFRQRFRLLRFGLVGWEELQEGLAVLAEYLVDGLDRRRVRQLAARVVAVQHLIDGASFIETFRSLNRTYGFNQRSSFRIALRVHRGGGLTKDAVYLSGLEAILRHLQTGGDLESLLIGKVGVRQVPIIRELQHRDVLRPLPEVPRHLRDPRALRRLEQLRGGGVSDGMLVANLFARKET